MDAGGGLRYAQGFYLSFIVMRTLLLVGGGHTHALYLLNARRFLPEDIRVLLVSPERFVPYSGMLPSLVAGRCRFRDSHIDLGQLCRSTETELVFGRVTDLDLEQRRAQLDDGRSLDFDLLSLNTGLRTGDALPGVEEHALCTKPVSRFLPQWQETLESLYARARNDSVNLGVVGGGSASIEMAMAIRYRLDRAERLRAPVQVHLLHAGGSLLPELPLAAQLRAAQMLQERQIRVHPLFQVARVEAHQVLTERHQHLPMDHVVWCARGKAGDWLARSGLASTDHGLLQVNQHLQSVSHPFVFAAGDIAHFSSAPLPTEGAIAVHQAPVLAANITRSLQSEPLRSFKPRKHYLTMIACGDEQALARWGNWVWAGRWVWRWKKRIDQRFMGQFPGV